MSLNYELKYRKYKDKYIQLKEKMRGGVPPKTNSKECNDNYYELQLGYISLFDFFGELLQYVNDYIRTNKELGDWSRTTFNIIDGQQKVLPSHPFQSKTSKQIIINIKQITDDLNILNKFSELSKLSITKKLLTLEQIEKKENQLRKLYEEYTKLHETFINSYESCTKK